MGPQLAAQLKPTKAYFYNMNNSPLIGFDRDYVWEEHSASFTTLRQPGLTPPGNPTLSGNGTSRKSIFTR